ncbi:MAG: iron export ABC transporter permease subunit FetB [Actinobacteria bacterium]|nr:iron export ABC transporter permease subunit FetB [Actinomycetota bacterium]
MTEIGWEGLAVSALLVVVALGLSRWRHLGLERSIGWAALRAVVQLAAVGLVLAAVFDANASLAWAWLWVAAMVMVSAETVRRRAREVPGLFALALSAFGVAAVVVLGVLFGLGVFDLEARTLVPLAGLMIGNALAATVLVARRVYEELRDREDEVEARLALGLPSDEAAAPYLRHALRTALIPQIETTKAVGLVVLPGAMTGLILAGVEPLDAVQVQAAVMFVVLGSVTTTTTVVALGVRRRLFTEDHRLVRLTRPTSR